MLEREQSRALVPAEGPQLREQSDLPTLFPFPIPPQHALTPCAFDPVRHLGFRPYLSNGIAGSTSLMSKLTDDERAAMWAWVTERSTVGDTTNIFQWPGWLDVMQRRYPDQNLGNCGDGKPTSDKR